MARDISIVLDEIIFEIELIEQATHDLSFQEFKRDIILKHAIQHAFLIISEAVRHIPSDILDDHPALPWEDIKRIGNHLRHEYFHVDDAIIWDVIDLHLNALKSCVEEMRTGL